MLCSHNNICNQNCIHPPGRSTKGLCPCCLENYIKTCLPLHLLKIENTCGQHLPLGFEENNGSKSKKSRKRPSDPRKTKQNTTKWTNGRSYYEEEQKLEEFDKMLGEKVMKQESFMKYIQEIQRGIEEFQCSVKEVEEKHHDLFHRYSKSKHNKEENTRSNGRANAKENLSLSSEITLNISQSNVEFFSQPAAESTRLTYGLPKNYPKGLYYGPNKGKVKENKKSENYSKLDELMKKLADSTKEIKMLIANIYEQDKVVASKQKMYIQAVEKHNQEHLKALEQLCVNINSSESDSSLNKMNKIETSKQQKARNSKDEDRNMTLEECIEKACADLAKWKSTYETEKEGKEEDISSISNSYEITSRWKDNNENYKSRRRQNLDEINYSGPFVLTHNAGNLGKANNQSPRIQVPCGINNNMTTNHSQEVKGIADLMENETNITQASPESESSMRTASQLSGIPKQFDSHFSSNDLSLHKRKSSDYVCKTVIKQILRRYPPSTLYAYKAIDGRSPQMTDIIRKVDQIVKDLMPVMGGEQQGSKLQVDLVDERDYLDPIQLW